jgi:hypothetical protein
VGRAPSLAARAGGESDRPFLAIKFALSRDAGAGGGTIREHLDGGGDRGPSRWCIGTPVDGMVRACDVSPGCSSLRSPEPAVLSRCPGCPSCRAMRAAGACGAAKRATTCAWGKQPHTEPNPAPAGTTSAEPSTRVARTSADATAPARHECRCPSWTLRRRLGVTRFTRRPVAGARDSPCLSRPAVRHGPTP